MTSPGWRSRATAAIVVAFLGGTASGAERVGGGLVGWVEDTRGVPVAGAVISLFGSGIRGGSLVTFSDSTGRFFLPSLPAGSYTLRALGSNYLPAPARRVTVPPDREATATLSLTPLEDRAEAASIEEADAAGTSEAARELRWLVRHKRRSVLEEQGPTVEVAEAGETVDATPHVPWLAYVDGSVELLASPGRLGLEGDSSAGDSPPLSFSVLRLKGRLADNGRWSLGGLVTESESTAWRMAAEFVLEPGGGHEIAAGSGYGLQLVRPIVPSDREGQTDNRSVGTLYVEDRWKVNDRLLASFGLRESYIGFVSDRNHLDPHLAMEVEGDSGMHLRAGVIARTVVPGGDLLRLSPRATPPVLAFAVIDEGLRPERMVHYELALGRTMGRTSLEAHAFHEGVRDQLVNAFVGRDGARSLRILNARGVSAEGVGVTVGHRFGEALSGSITYTYGQSSRAMPAPNPGTEELSGLAFRRAGFHDVVTRVETFLGLTDTRVAALCRFNAMSPESERASGATLGTTRFDVQLNQGLPFLGTLTRADWELLLAVRNFFYEADEAALLDELAVLNPPKQVLGGISVRF